MLNEPGKKDNDANGMKRAQSSLELLSQTAAVLDQNEEEAKLLAGGGVVGNDCTEELVGLCTTIAQRPSLGTSISATVSPSVNRVTPAEQQGFLLERIRCSHLSLPDMAGGGGAHTTASISIAPKHTFLPAPLSFEGAYYGVTNAGLDVDRHTPVSPPGMYFCYTTGANTSATGRSVSNESDGSSEASGGGNSSAHAHPSVQNSASFSSGIGSMISTASATGFVPTSAYSTVGVPSEGHGPPSTLTMPSTAAAAFVPPRPSLTQQHQIDPNSNSGNPAPQEFGIIPQRQQSDDSVIRENFYLRQQLVSKDATIASLENQVAALKKEVSQLRQLPTGKISQIPIEDMLSLMREYGSEVSDTAMPPRKSYVQKASVVRQFRRWNPNFLQYFEFKDGTWHPKLGKAGELRRRQEARRIAAEIRKKQAVANCAKDDAVGNDAGTSDKDDDTDEGLNKAV